MEEIDAIMDSSGHMISCEVNGVIEGNSRLSGIPDLTMVFTDPSVLDDCSFHPCVRYQRYERERVISFVPPDGPFEVHDDIYIYIYRSIYIYVTISGPLCRDR